MAILLSVVICTFNRAQFLQSALESICNQTISENAYEIIVIDNMSTDQTEEVVASYKRDHSNVRYFFEQRIGLSNARNRGWKVSKGVYVGYIDDDSKVPENWVFIAQKVINSYKPDVFGGPIFPFYNAKKPVWYKDEYGTLCEGSIQRELNENEYLCGSNLIIRKELLHLINGFSSDFGMSGKKMAYGEETELIIRLRKNVPNVKIFYKPELFVKHIVRNKGMKFSWLFKQRFIQGRYGYLSFSGRKHKISIRYLVGFLGIPFIIFYEFTIGIITRDRNKYPLFQNYIYERILHLVRIWGKLYERLFRTILEVGKINKA